MIGQKLWRDWNMRYQKFELFPTNVFKFDCTESFNQDEVYSMVHDIDMLVEDGTSMQYNELTPKHQSKPILFQPDAPPVWQKLKHTFLEACKLYLENTENFVSNQKSLEFTGSRAWFYKGWNSLNSNENNPWHDHHPSFLSGVFYLKVPDAAGGGTEFMDPRANESKSTRNVCIEPNELCWVIFPGSMTHKSELSDSEQPRYVIAADSYVKVS